MGNFKLMDDLHLFIYGEIGGSGGMFFEDEGPNVEDIQKQLTESKAENVVVHISSPGGSVFDGWTIGNIIKNSGKKTTALIEGFCASIATYVALSCDRVEMADTARFLIHNPSLGLEGDQEDLTGAAEQLASIKDDLIRVYKDKTGISINQLSKMMDEETNLTTDEAIKQGFVDGRMTPLKAVAYINNNKMPEVKDKEVAAKISALDKIIAKGEKLYKKLMYQDEAHNVSLTLADGSTIFVESEDGELEGKNAFTVDEEGNPTETPVEDGTHALEDGRSITVEGGVVTSVQEGEPTEEVDILKDQVKNLEAQIAKASTEKDETVKANKKESDETKSSLLEVMEEIKNLKKMTAGDTGELKKANVKPQNKFDPEPVSEHKLDAWVNEIFKNR